MDLFHVVLEGLHALRVNRVVIRVIYLRTRTRVRTLTLQAGFCISVFRLIASVITIMVLGMSIDGLSERHGPHRRVYVGVWMTSVAVCIVVVKLLVRWDAVLAIRNHLVSYGLSIDGDRVTIDIDASCSVDLTTGDISDKSLILRGACH